MYFARRQEGDKSEMPHFAGQRGPEILRGLIEIEAVFDKNLSMLYEVKKTILDVKATTWHDDYNRLDTFDFTCAGRLDIFDLSCASLLQLYFCLKLHIKLHLRACNLHDCETTA